MGIPGTLLISRPTRSDHDIEGVAMLETYMLAASFRHTRTHWQPHTHTHTRTHAHTHLSATEFIGAGLGVGFREVGFHEVGFREVNLI